MQSAKLQVYLRGLDLLDLAQRYLEGEFVNLTTPIPVSLGSVKELPKSVMTVKDKASFEHDIGIGRNFAIIGYKACGKDGKYEYVDKAKTYNCMYCIRPIPNRSLPIGIPVMQQIRPDGKKIDHMIDIFCTPECAYAELRTRLSNPIYSHSIELLSEIFLRMTGKNISEFKPANDKRLLSIFNGDVTWDEFHANTTKYSQKPGNMIFLPVAEYIEQD